MAVPFQVDSIEELVDGRLFVQWTTIADDGLRLEEGDYFTPEEGESLEDCLNRRLGEVKASRDRINASPKARKPSRPPRKQTTRVMTDAQVAAIRDAHRQDGAIPDAGAGLVD